ncbi:MAG: 4Fe-4S dicluster domain-containing protein [Pseudomonadota bacterium]
MGVNRRDFLKIAGISAAALGVKPAVDAIASEHKEAVPERGLDAPVGAFSLAQRYAMVIDVKKLTAEDYEACAAACHRVHNVPDIRKSDGSVDVMHEVKWIWRDEYENVFPEQANPFADEITAHKDFLVLCNHCDSPPCVRVCPTQATWKRENDGIVVIDMHRCIGCRFCMAGCPYGSRSFNWSDPRPFIKETNPTYPTRMKGVVEKCNFCVERLAKGLFPACVEACKSGALTFGDLESPSSTVRELLRKHHTIRRKPSLGTGPNIFYIV